MAYNEHDILVLTVLSLLDTSENVLSELCRRCPEPAHLEQLAYIQLERNYWRQKYGIG